MKPLALALSFVVLAGCSGPAGPSASSAKEVHKHLVEGGVRCIPDGEPIIRVTGSEGYGCRLDDEFLMIDYYFSDDQMDQAVSYYQDINPGDTFITGQRWSISAKRPETVAAVIEAMDVDPDQVLFPVP